MNFRSQLTVKEKKILFFALGIGSYGMAANMFYSPKPSELGLLRIVENWLLDSFGSIALVMLWVVTGSTLLLAALFTKD